MHTFRIQQPCFSAPAFLLVVAAPYLFRWVIFQPYNGGGVEEGEKK